MGLPDLIPLYEEIDEKNKILVKNFSKNGTYGIVAFRDDSDNLIDHMVVRRCNRRNIWRLFHPKQFRLDEVIELVLPVLDVFLPSDAILWVCVEDPEEYTKLGFGNPYFCKYDPFFESTEHPVAVSKVNDPLFQTNARVRHTGTDTDPEQYQQRRTSPIREVSYNLFDFVTDNRQDTEIQIKFNQDDLSYLQKLIYSGRTMNKDGTMTQKEVSGLLYLNMKEDHFELCLDKSKNFNAHDEEKVRFVNGLCNFHTHPTDVYHRYDVDLLYPSPGDYISILTLLIQKYPFEDPQFCITPLLFSCVVAVEGIYIISLSKNYCSNDALEVLRENISDLEDGHYKLKRSVSEAINSKHKGISGFYYGSRRTPEDYYETHCKYIGDPADHPLGCTQVGGYDYDTLDHNRSEAQLSHFPTEYKHNGVKLTRIEQAAKDYCLKINRRELMSGVKFALGPVLNVQYFSYSELEKTKFPITAIASAKDGYVTSQLLLDEETIAQIEVFSDFENPNN